MTTSAHAGAGVRGVRGFGSQRASMSHAEFRKISVDFVVEPT